MRYLVTGGAGFIGSHYVRSLLDGTLAADVDRVTVLDKLTYAGVRANLDPVSGDPRLDFVHGDILDADAVDPLVATPTFSSTSLPSPTSTGRSPGPTTSC